MTRQAGGGRTFVGVALTFAAVYLAAGALMPLMVVYRERWSLSAATMTLAFAAFAPAFLAAVLTLGSLSDRIGRRPVLIGALLIQIGSIVMFLVAPNVGWVIGARVMQGFATGAATPAFTAALVELAPLGRKPLGTMIGSVSLTGGLAAGSLLAGLVVQLTGHANAVTFLALAVITAAGIGAVVSWREPLTRAPGAERAHGPRLAVPPCARTEFAGAVPVLAGVWMVSGLSGGIAPSLVRSVFGVNSGLLNGLSGFVAPAASTVVGVAVGRALPRRMMVVGILASVVGTAGVVAGVVTGQLTTMIAGQTIAGAGFGASFTAALRLVMPLAKEHERAGLAAAIYLVSYTAFGVPMVLAGQAVSAYGTGPTIIWFGVVACALALLGLRRGRE
ncbi:Major Facilitator Superfamily protein [uncultured Mycobacterium sp.]|uniref:Major Facilitator Superfamily protein n=1 Tax=uncultured Mycobacterium sp. TaxID=171292 RepID=A0A1Y5PGM6_9MYCO|nr:Major Facilitator Superfamily protein [uncultured Mycobacterium sp.]